MRACVCAQDAGLTVLPFLQPMSTTIYVYPSAWNTRTEMCHTCRWECDSCSKAWALRRFIYCFNDAVCFIFMYFVRNDEIKLWTYKIYLLISNIFSDLNLSNNDPECARGTSEMILIFIIFLLYITYPSKISKYYPRHCYKNISMGIWMSCIGLSMILFQ